MTESARTGTTSSAGSADDASAIVFRIALTQAMTAPPAQAYLARREAEGKIRREAQHALKRFLIRAV